MYERPESCALDSNALLKNINILLMKAIVYVASTDFLQCHS